MRRAILALGIFLGVFASNRAAQAAAILTGQLVNLRVGDGTTLPSGTALPVILDVYDITYTAGLPTAISLAQSIPVQSGPTGGTQPTSGQRNLMQGGSANGEGGLALSVDRRYMTLGGYNSTLGGSASGNNPTTPNRVIGRLDLSDGTVDTTTALTDASGTTNAVRSVVSIDGTQFWMGASTGVRYVNALGATTSLAIGATANNVRRSGIYKGQLYQTEGSNSRFGIVKVGTGTPTTNNQTLTLLNGFPGSTNSAYDFFFADDNTVYIADDRSTTSGGLEKWVFSGTSWSMVFNHPIALTGSNNGLRSLTGSVDANGNVTLFAATANTGALPGAPNLLVGLTDTVANTSSANVTENLLVTASSAFSGTAWNLRGVALVVPEPASMGLIVLGGLLLARRRG